MANCSNQCNETCTDPKQSCDLGHKCVWNLDILDVGPYGTPQTPVRWSIVPNISCATETYIVVPDRTTPLDVDTSGRLNYPHGDPSNPDPAEEIGIVTEEDPVTGRGQFDKYMRAGNNQIDIQYNLGRIKGAEYANAFVQMQDNMMTQANGFVLGEFKTRIEADLVSAQIEEMQLDGEVKRTLVQAQILETEMKIRLLAEQIDKVKNETQLIATQEEELRKNGAFDRAVTYRQANKLIAETDFICTQNTEFKNTQAFDRVIKYEEAAKIKTESRFVASKEKMMLANDNINRMLTMQQMYHEQAKINLTCKNETLVDTQCKLNKVQAEELGLSGYSKRNLEGTQASELVLNGESKRSLETEQEEVARKQAHLYEEQAKGFDNRNRNDTLKTFMNAWAVQASEIAEDPTQSSISTLYGNNAIGHLGNALTKAGI